MQSDIEINVVGLGKSTTGTIEVSSNGDVVIRFNSMEGSLTKLAGTAVVYDMVKEGNLGPVLITRLNNTDLNAFFERKTDET